VNQFCVSRVLIITHSQLDSATSLIQAAKNLMNAVVLTVKASYVASTKYPRQGTVSVGSVLVVCLAKLSRFL
jgi:Vinculin family